MPGIIEFPKVVQDALDQYGDLFANGRDPKMPLCCSTLRVFPR